VSDTGRLTRRRAGQDGYSGVFCRAWGRKGIAARIERCLAAEQQSAAAIRNDERFELMAPPTTGIVVWRPRDNALLETMLGNLPQGMVSTTMARGLRLHCGRGRLRGGTIPFIRRYRTIWP
jgi:hypothetical protein